MPRITGFLTDNFKIAVLGLYGVFPFLLFHVLWRKYCHRAEFRFSDFTKIQLLNTLIPKNYVKKIFGWLCQTEETIRSHWTIFGLLVWIGIHFEFFYMILAKTTLLRKPLNYFLKTFFNYRPSRPVIYLIYHVGLPSFWSLRSNS